MSIADSNTSSVQELLDQGFTETQVMQYLKGKYSSSNDEARRLMESELGRATTDDVPVDLDDQYDNPQD